MWYVRSPLDWHDKFSWSATLLGMLIAAVSLANLDAWWWGAFCMIGALAVPVLAVWYVLLPVRREDQGAEGDQGSSA